MKLLLLRVLRILMRYCEQQKGTQGFRVFLHTSASIFRFLFNRIIKLNYFLFQHWKWSTKYFLCSAYYYYLTQDCWREMFHAKRLLKHFCWTPFVQNLHFLHAWCSWIRALRYDYERNQQDATLQVYLLFLVSSTCFGWCFRLSSETLDCIYIIW
jgi:hypothetical protein